MNETYVLFMSNKVRIFVPILSYVYDCMTPLVLSTQIRNAIDVLFPLLKGGYTQSELSAFVRSFFIVR
jgi:hypothetical protein